MNVELLRSIHPAGADRVHLVHNGVDISAFRPVARPERTRVRACSIGRLVDKKGFETLIDAVAQVRRTGADLVLGHGPHVLRGMELYKDRLIAYSMGNFATYGRFNVSGNQGIGAILDITLDSDGQFIAGRILGTHQEGEGVPVPDPANAAADLMRTLTLTDFPTYGVVIAQDGTFGR